jgi:hypothetical protein
MTGVLLLAACGSGARAPATTVAPVVTPTPTPTLSSDLERTIENAVLACREKDAGALRALVAGDVTQQEVDALFALGRDVVLQSQTEGKTVDGTVSVTVGLEITRATGVEDVDRTWQLAQGADGLWRFAALPDCY